MHLETQRRNKLILFDEIGRGTATWRFRNGTVEAIITHIHEHLTAKYYSQRALSRVNKTQRDEVCDFMQCRELLKKYEVVFLHKVLEGLPIRATEFMWRSWLDFLQSC